MLFGRITFCMALASVAFASNDTDSDAETNNRFKHYVFHSLGEVWASNDYGHIAYTIKFSFFDPYLKLLTDLEKHAHKLYDSEHGTLFGGLLKHDIKRVKREFEEMKNFYSKTQRIESLEVETNNATEPSTHEVQTSVPVETQGKIYPPIAPYILMHIVP